MVLQRVLTGFRWEERQGVASADTMLMAGLGLMIFFIPTSESLKNVGYFLALAGWLLKRALSRDWRLALTPLGAFFLLYLLVSLLSAAFAIDRWEGLKGTWDVFRPFSLFLIIINDLRSEGRIHLCLWFFIVSTGIGVLWGLTDYVRGMAYKGYLLGIHSLGFPNHTATYLAMMLVLILSLLLTMHWSVRATAFLGAVMAMTGLALFLTYSRGAWVGFLVALLFLSRSLRRWKPLVVVATLVACSIVGFQLIGKPSDMRESAYKPLHLVPYNMMSSVRSDLWSGVIRDLKDRPLLGVGPRNFINLDYARYGSKQINHAHSLFFNVLAERGLLGLLSLLALLVCYLYQGVKLHRQFKTEMGQALWHAAMGCFIVTVVNGVFNTTLHSEGAIALWTTTALMISAVKRGLEESPVKGRAFSF